MHMWPMNEAREADALADELNGIEIVEGLSPPPRAAAGRDGARRLSCLSPNVADSRQRESQKRRRRSLRRSLSGRLERKTRAQKSRKSRF